MAEAIAAPRRGALTWSQEGTEGGKFHSRKLHVPSDSSGATIGRGYDMKNRTAAQVQIELMAASVDKDTASKLSQCAGKKGEDARKYIKDNGLDKLEITAEAQMVLFENEYAKLSAETKRLCTKADVTQKYGKCDWESMDPALKELVIDMRYRGDYTPAARAKIQQALVTQDYAILLTLFSSKSNWPDVPKERFNARKALVQRAANTAAFNKASVRLSKSR